MTDKPDDAWERERNQHVLNALRGIVAPVDPAAAKPASVATPDAVREAARPQAPENAVRGGPVLRPEQNLDAIARQRPVVKAPSAPKPTMHETKTPIKPESIPTVKPAPLVEADVIPSRPRTGQGAAAPVKEAGSPLRASESVHTGSASPVEDRISHMREPRLLSIDDLEAKRIIHPAHSNRRAVEHFRDLRTRLLQISKGQNFTLVVSSAVNNGGASFAAINLAAAFAFDSSKTALLVDCNLRYPSLHHAFDMIPELGVTDFLDDPVMDVGSIIYPTGIKRMRFVPAGKRREATGEYFTSYRMKQFLSSVHSRYPDRFIILDTPSINESPDAGILAELADYTLIVVPHGKVTEGKVLEACARVPREKLLGVVVNN